jgi:hypothetical protein
VDAKGVSLSGLAGNWRSFRAALLKLAKNVPRPRVHINRCSRRAQGNDARNASGRFEAPLVQKMKEQEGMPSGSTATRPSDMALSIHG